MERQKYFWNPLMDYWFRMEVEGWENVPKHPALLIGIHSGAPFVWDAWTVGVQWWRHFGPERALHGTASRSGKRPIRDCRKRPIAVWHLEGNVTVAVRSHLCPAPPSGLQPSLSRH